MHIMYPGQKSGVAIFFQSIGNKWPILFQNNEHAFVMSKLSGGWLFCEI